MKLLVYSLEGSLFEGDVAQVSLPAKDGEITILPEHIPLITILKKGLIKIGHGSDMREIEIPGGFAEIDGEKVVVLAN